MRSYSWGTVLSVGVLLGMFGACAPRVGGERSTIATFPRYRTYAWAGPAIAARPTEQTGAAILDWRIRAAVDAALAARGYERTSGAASLLVDYDVVVPSTGGAAFRAYFRDRRSAAEDLGDMSRGFPAGSLVVYLVDARTRELAYRGWAFDVIADDASPARVDDAVSRMLAAVPAVSDARSAGPRGQ